MLRKNENRIWNALAQIPNLPDAAAFALESKREKILIKLYQFILMGIDLWFTIFEPYDQVEENPTDASLTLSELPEPLGPSPV
jgi:hypothetical protein